MDQPKLSIITTVLNSHEMVRRQLLYLDKFVPADCEVIVVDDGSDPPLFDCMSHDLALRMDLLTLATGDKRPWTQPAARNKAANVARADRLLFFDIDHIITADIIRHACDVKAYKMHWWRTSGALSTNGDLITDETQLYQEFGMGAGTHTIHENSFMIDKQTFNLLGGYDERFCGRYGGDDVDFTRRYEELCKKDSTLSSVVCGLGYVFCPPNNAKYFHSLSKEQTNFERRGSRIILKTGRSMGKSTSIAFRHDYPISFEQP